MSQICRIIQDAAGQQIRVEIRDSLTNALAATAIVPRYFNIHGSPNYPGSGSPNLPANVTYNLYDRATDLDAKADWICTAAGTNMTSGWAQISGGAGIDFATPVNWSKDSSYGPKKVVYVQKSNAVVGTGVTDADTGLLTKAFPGLWVTGPGKSVAPVPDPANPGQFKYRVPQWPLPVPDDYDNALNYWLPLDPACL